jgi:hypothetical protein
MLCIIGLGMPLPASAGIVTTDQIYAGAERDRVRDFMLREDVRTQMQSLGVDADSVRERVDAMTDEEVSKLAGRIDQAPAGGDVLGILFAVFIILLVTDILGLTKVFPFTRSVR